MAYIKRIKGRGVQGAVTAFGEVLFAPGADVNRFGNRLTARTKAATVASFQSTRKGGRPRWAHNGPPLASTFTATRQRVSKTNGGARLYSAVGSTARYSYYVDQGTGVFGGNGLYKAKILPPWERGHPSLYEHTWKPGGPRGKTVAPVWIKGQKGQQFFATGLKKGFQSVRMRSFQVPGEGYSGISEAMNVFPRGLEFNGNTPVTPGFIASLDEWRTWRDAAWTAREDLGKPRPAKPVKRRRGQSNYSMNKPKPNKPVKPSAEQKDAARRRIMSLLRERGVQVRGLTLNNDHTWTALIKGPRDRIFKQQQGRW